MDNAQKAIMIGVGLFITIIIISAVLLIVNLGTDLMGGAANELGSISGVLKSQILDTYDGKTMNGSQILAAVRQYSNSSSVSMTIYPKSGDAINVGAKVLTVTDGEDDTKYVVGGIQNCEVAKGTTQKYSEIASTIPAQDYFKTAVAYDSQGNVIGIAAIHTERTAAE